MTSRPRQIKTPKHYCSAPFPRAANPGVLGRLAVVATALALAAPVFAQGDAEQETWAANPRDVVIYEVLPKEPPRVAGIISAVPRTPLSHINLHAVQDGVHNAFIRDARDDDDEEYNPTVGVPFAMQIEFKITRDNALAPKQSHLPSATANLRAESSDGDIRISWDDPEDSSITGYDYRVRVVPQEVWRPDWTMIANSADRTSLTVFNIQVGVTIEFQLRARNANVPAHTRAWR